MPISDVGTRQLMFGYHAWCVPVILCLQRSTVCIVYVWLYLRCVHLQARVGDDQAPSPAQLQAEKEALRSENILVVLGSLHAILKNLWSFKVGMGTRMYVHVCIYALVLFVCIYIYICHM